MLRHSAENDYLCGEIAQSMEHQQYQKRRVASIRIEHYLAQYAKCKFDIDPKSGGVRIPDSFDLYHCVWQVMERRPRNYADPQDTNLTIWLPARRNIDGVIQKNPAYWNYISPRNARLVEKSLRRLFNWEFHHYVEEQLLCGATKVEAVRRFISRYDLGIDSEDALLKNLQRYERTLAVFLGLKKPRNVKKRTF